MPKEEQTGANARMIDVIIPAFRGYEQTVKCVSSVLTSACHERFELIVVDDASPEPALSKWLRCLADQGRITLLANEANLGFVASVNRAMALHADRDAVLLNSDCEVAGNWLDRLARCATSDSSIATATPFSNNATICSYPLASGGNALPPGWSLAELDAAFAAANAARSMPLPTAVGSCMYVRRACWDSVGGFDEARFGRGYGEECDFSMRARAAGWKHVLCADVFVYHEGSVSFGDERRSRVEAAEAIIDALHPDYHPMVRAFVIEDPLQALRHRVSAARARRSLDDALVIVDELSAEHRLIRQTSVERFQETTRVEEVLRTALDDARARGDALDAALAEAQRFVRERENDVMQIASERARDLAQLASERDACLAALRILEEREASPLLVRAQRQLHKLSNFLRRP